MAPKIFIQAKIQKTSRSCNAPQTVRNDIYKQEREHAFAEWQAGRGSVSKRRCNTHEKTVWMKCGKCGFPQDHALTLCRRHYSTVAEYCKIFTVTCALYGCNARLDGTYDGTWPPQWTADEATAFHLSMNFESGQSLQNETV